MNLLLDKLFFFVFTKKRMYKYRLQQNKLSKTFFDLDFGNFLPHKFEESFEIQAMASLL